MLYDLLTIVKVNTKRLSPPNEKSTSPKQPTFLELTTQKDTHSQTRSLPRSVLVDSRRGQEHPHHTNPTRAQQRDRFVYRTQPHTSILSCLSAGPPYQRDAHIPKRPLVHSRMSKRSMRQVSMTLVYELCAATICKRNTSFRLLVNAAKLPSPQSVRAPNKPDIGAEVQNTPNSQSNG